MEKVVSEKLVYNDNDIIGKGIAGFVFRGSFGDDLIPVAVKRVKLASVNKEAVQKRGEDTLKGLDHENVVKLFHVEQDEVYRYFALELCDASLDHCYNEHQKYHGPMPSPKDILLQLATGLHYIHSKMLIYCDIKPENVLISASTDPVLIKLADFGLSKPVNNKGTFLLSSGIKGSNYWMAPEVLESFEQQQYSKDTDDSGIARGTAQSDIFSLGLVYFTVVTNGLHLFGSRNLITPNISRGKRVQLNKLDQKHFAYELINNMTKQKPGERMSLSEVINTLKPL